MVNALWSSRSGGTKEFRFTPNGRSFGWDAPTEQFFRDFERQKCNECPRVPGLLLEYINRDSWSRMNMEPATTVICENCLVEYDEYINKALREGQGDSQSVRSAMGAKVYLEALSKIFRIGMLSHEKLLPDLTKSSIVRNIDDGFKTFISWYEQLSKDATFRYGNRNELRFLAPQTWELLRICVSGFLKLCHIFSNRASNSAQYLIPWKVNNSGVETVFSQLKACCGGKLTSIAYPFARKRLQIKADIEPAKKRKSGYRDALRCFATFEPIKKRRKCNELQSF